MSSSNVSVSGFTLLSEHIGWVCNVVFWHATYTLRSYLQAMVHEDTWMNFPSTFLKALCALWKILTRIDYKRKLKTWKMKQLKLDKILHCKVDEK